MDGEVCLDGEVCFDGEVIVDIPLSTTTGSVVQLNSEEIRDKKSYPWSIRERRLLIPARSRLELKLLNALVHISVKARKLS